MTVNRKTIVFSFVLIFFMLVCCLTPNESYWLNWLGILIFVYAICVWHWERKESYFCLYTIFFFFMLVFNYGQCVMWALGIGTDIGIGTKELFYGTRIIPSDANLLYVKWYTCISMLIFHFGALLLSKRKKKDRYSWFESRNILLEKKNMFLIGSVITIVLYPIALFTKFRELIISLNFGYRALYYGDYATQSGYISILMYLFFPGLVCMLIGSEFSKKTTRVVWILFGIYAFIGLLSGDRGSWIYSVVILIWLLIQHKGIKWKTLFKYGCLAIVGVYFVDVIIAARDVGGLFSLDINDFLNMFRVENSPIVKVFFEMGNTMSVLTYFLIKGKSIYPYENTYLVSVLGAISSRFLSILGIEQILIADWFSQKHLGLTWGTGFSMIAEAYVNGGWLGGFIYMGILGAIIGKILCMCRDSNDINNHPLKVFIAVSTAEIIVGFPRAAAYLIVKNFIYGICTIVAMVYFLGKIKSKR